MPKTAITAPVKSLRLLEPTAEGLLRWRDNYRRQFAHITNVREQPQIGVILRVVLDRGLSILADGNYPIEGAYAVKANARSEREALIALIDQQRGCE